MERKTDVGGSLRLISWILNIETPYQEFWDGDKKESVPLPKRVSVVCSFSKNDVVPTALLDASSFCGDRVAVEDIVSDPDFPYTGEAVVTRVAHCFSGNTEVCMEAMGEWTDRKVFGGQKAKVSLKG